MLVERTVSRWRDRRWESEGETLADYRSAHAYVLLGEAGSGKTTALRGECEHDPVTARQFIRGNPLEWNGNTLFIDGLDEQRAAGGDPGEPLNRILRRIERIGRPRFRLSCRDEAWLGEDDLRELSSVTNGEEVHRLRLDPLSSDGAREILASMGIKEPDDFLWNAGERGLDTFLRNPLLLELLAEVVHPEAAGSERWPDTQRDTFERACRILADEPKQENRDARDGPPYSGDELVMAASRLCAIALLSDKLGWSRRGLGDEDHPPLSDAGAPQELFRFALDTKLFEGSAETGRSPRHRRYAEFLAAKCLDRRIRAGLPATRVLALMAGGDGMVAPDLLGVSAWLATMNREARAPLIDMDPASVMFGGDAGPLSRQEVERLLSRLESQLGYRWIEPSWAALDSLLAGPAKHMLWARLRDSDRSPGRQQLVELLLRGLTPIAGSDAGWAHPARANAAEARDPLLAVVRDDTWWDWVRYSALRALIHVVRDEPDGTQVLLRLLRELSDDGARGDDRDELRGELLVHLYPGHIGPQQIWDYMPSSALGRGASFWKRDLVENSSPEQVRVLLQILMARAEELLIALAHHGLEVVPFRVLARALELFGEEADVDELYEWFELVEADYERVGLVPAHCQDILLRSRHANDQKRIYGWLGDHRDTQLALLMEGLERNASAREDRSLHTSVGRKFLGDDPPSGFRRWCLRRAVEMVEVRPRASTELRWWATMQNEPWGQPLSNEEVAALTRNSPRLREWNDRRLEARASEADETARRYESPRYKRVLEQQSRYVASVREQLTTLEAGEGPLEMLHELGRVYVNGLEAGGPEKARSELEIRLGSDRHTADAVVRGFRRLVDRTDLPTMEDIVQLQERRRMSGYELPFLAGLTEDERAEVDAFERLDEVGLRRALAFYFRSLLPTTRHPLPGNFSHAEDCRPRWYRDALERRPDAVADVIVAVHRARVRAKELPDQHLYDMAAKGEYARVAPLAVARMLTPFPTRCAGEGQLSALRQVLLAAIRYMPDHELAGLVSKRLARSGMDVAQQAYWLAAGGLVAPAEYLPGLLDFLLAEGEARVGHVVDFLVPDLKPLPNQEWSTAHLAGLIRAVGSKLHSPRDDLSDSTDQFMGGDGLETGIKAESLMNGWIKTLVNRMDSETSAALAKLADDPALAKWRARLQRARDEQAETRRTATRRVPAVGEVRDALEKGPPASAADLAALVAERLQHLAKQVRDGSTDDWMLYWHTDPTDQAGRTVIRPKPESPCRRVLVSAVEPLLDPHGVAVSQEEQVAEEKRPDIVAHYHRHAVPIEVKKTHSPDLWTAAADQLQGLYCRDPRSDGYGIYLVLWFGADDLKKAPPSGRRPESPGELRDRLLDELAPEHRPKIRVIVIDVSAPPGRRAELAT
ncbi:MAG: hypothetical protein OXG58_08135 [Gemmatimonadetes bacterium]|nr:hypothetical protein [Gemmatimonadota bacterium]MCY3942949.1 hypothetical protein [Gemmatimonadota bacterium]